MKLDYNTKELSKLKISEKHKNFLSKLEENNTHYKEGDFEVLGLIGDKAIMLTKFGLVSVRRRHLLSGGGFSIESALDKNEFFKNKVKEVHGKIYDLSKIKYTKTRNKVTIGCKEHGFVEIIANNLLNGRGCPKCGKEVLKTKIKNNGGWRYSDWRDKALKSKDFDSYKLYLIRCWDENEEFYKIGRTFNTVFKRFKGNNKSTSLPYEWEIVDQVKCEWYDFICRKEDVIHRRLKRYKYTPLKNFSGSNECYSLDLRKEITKYKILGFDPNEI